MKLTRVKPHQYMVLTLLMLISNANAQINIDARYSGSWFDPSHSGEGFVGTGNIQNNSVVSDELLQTQGAVFGDEFKPEDVQSNDFGDLTISWADCLNANASYTVNGVTGNQTLSRVTNLAG